MKMKKMLSLVLVLCMALAAVSVLAEEEDFTGTWYLLMYGITGATFELNADGTFTGSVTMSGESEPAEGTWSAEGSTVTFSVNGQSLSLTYDGTDLLLSEEAVSTYAGDISTTGLDVSVLASLMKFSREPGSVTMAEFTAYQQDGTVPEGKTKEEMDAIYAEMMVSILSLAGSMNIGDTASTGIGSSAESAAAPELTILEENFFVIETYFGMEGEYIAKVQNNTDTTFCISDGTLVLKDADGNEVGRKEYLGESGSRYLEPGEITYVSMDADISEGATVADYEMTFENRLPESYTTTDVALEIGETELRINDSYWSSSYYAAGTVTNTGDEPLSQIHVVFALRSSDGKLVDVASTSLGPNELAAGSTITLVESLSSYIVDYCTANGLTLSEEVEALAYSENY